MNRISTCAALYFEPQPQASVPPSWFEMACTFLHDHNSPVQGFSLTAAGFADEDYSFAAYKEQLIQALRKGLVEGLCLDSSLALEQGDYDYRGEASLERCTGMSFLSIDESIIGNPFALLRTAHDVARDIPGSRYGIAYKSPASSALSLYAAGVHYGNFADAEQWFKGNVSTEFQRISAWSHEMSGARRYLTGMFRGAYAASLLSDAHVNARVRKGSLLRRSATLRSLGIGKLTQIDRGLWLWGLAEDQIPIADAMLDEAGLLIR